MTFLDNGTLDVAALGAAGTGAITIAAGTETLQIENTALSHDKFGNTVVDFGFGDRIDLTGLAFGPGATASYNPSTGILSVTSHGVTDKLTLTSPAAVTSFVPNNDGNGGTEVELVQPPTITGTQANQRPMSSPFHPFGQVVIGDPNPGQTETVKITVGDNAGVGIVNALLYGVLSDPNAASDGSHNANGVYTVTGSTSAVTAALQGLLATVGLDDTHYIIQVTDTIGAPAIDHTTSIIGHLG